MNAPTKRKVVPMSVKGTFETTGLSNLERVLDLAAMRQRVYAKNIANANVPTYQRQEVPFAEELGRSTRLRLAATQAGHAHSAPGGQVPYQIATVSEDGEAKNVDLDTEMVAVAENQLRFNLAARLAAMQIAGLRASIKGSS